MSTSLNFLFGRLVPGDLLIEIAFFLEARQDVLNLCLTSQHAFSNVSSVLYEVVVLKSTAQCETTLGMLFRRPDIARHVRQLVVRLNERGEAVVSNITSAIASAAVRKVAGAMVLDALIRFEWGDEELPLFDDMWFALRRGCPQLRYISTSLGSTLPASNSHFFDFRNLSGFAMTLKSGFFRNNTDMFLQADSLIFKKFRTMLVVNCPNLEELILGGASSSVPADIHFLVDSRWPKLRKLSLGDISVDLFPLLPNEKPPFVSFLEDHPGLESLCLSRHSLQPHLLGTLMPSALQNLANFAGTIYQLQAIPHLHSRLKSVAFCDSVELREISWPTLGNLLRNLTSLTELKISFTLHSMYDGGNLLKSLTQSCPKLHHLELTCGHKLSFQLDSFAKTIRDFPKLRSLHLTIVRFPGDETVSCGAARIARSNPRLKNFKLTFISQRLSIPLLLSIPYHVVLLGMAYPSKCTGTYELVCDTHGLPFFLRSIEQNLYHWPWGRGTSTRTKKYVQNLRPKSYYYGGGNAGNEIVGLAFECSAAGEEMRMMLFCALLALLAACGIWTDGLSRETGC